MSEENGADVNLNVAGQQIAIRNVKSLNTLATIATLILVVLLGYAFWEHKLDASAQEIRRETSLAKRDDLIATAINNQTKEQRISNCLMDKMLNSEPAQRRSGGTHLPECERMVR
jgi:hypothetical protein